MKFGHEYETALASEGYPEQWVNSAIDYKHLKKCIKRVHKELESLGLDEHTLAAMNDLVAQPQTPNPAATDSKDYLSAANPDLSPIQEEFAPQLKVLVDSKTGRALDARLAPETKASLQKLARHEMVVEGRKKRLEQAQAQARPKQPQVLGETAPVHDGSERKESVTPDVEDARWVYVPLASAQDFFEMLEPKLAELDALRDAETRNLEEKILDLGDLVEDVVQPVREGYEAKRSISYRDLYFWREMFRLYLEKPIFYSETEQKRGAITFDEAKKNLENYDQTLRETGLLAKMKTPKAKAAAQQFLDLNLQILKVMHFQEMNARAMRKILKKFDKRTHLQGDKFAKNLIVKYPEIKSNKSGFADSIGRDLQAEMGTKVLAIVPQLDDWICPVCCEMAWRPVNLGCCRAVLCIRCVIDLQAKGMTKCPMCNAETVMQANGKNLDMDTMEFLEIYFPMEVKKRQKENEMAQLARDYGDEFIKPGCTVM
ncbi:hypothetical protein M409DRAFT_52140 [Zasmidium cellare ATCC 36951]|uniref:RING-type domain-containing protein n=1 Tax=Zasmidium cellare ATCC 36951 TaxID=1080233 RepID=A0A6A6CSD7_ZASCE|nr:uncharacterized protein M409DRAFT_52140 [Zasmidium cellare ATCC 36951]KAF2169613.1 hypothetical protein M409DRAFT_52140 [Zasmidium cellare ATCC 36951]